MQIKRVLNKGDSTSTSTKVRNKGISQEYVITITGTKKLTDKSRKIALALETEILELQ